jgi:DNA helicase HerA-like ATPase
MARQYIVDPQIAGNVLIGTEGTDTQVYLGRLAETGPLRRVHFAGSQEFVVLILGKRGSGKSHTLGALLEGLATKEDETSISRHRGRRAALLLDPMGNFWTTLHAVRPDGPEKVRRQWASLDGWNCKPEAVNAAIWLPAGFKNENDPGAIQEFRVRVSDLDASDIADLIGVNLMKDAQGAALSEAFVAVSQEGWNNDAGRTPAKADYSFADLIGYLEYLRERRGGGDHSAATLRALVRSLRALERQAVFSGSGTALTELLSPGRLSILMLPLRVGGDLRRVITRLLIRRILREREQTSQIQQRLDVESMEDATRARLTAELARRAPRSILALDEAQELLGDDAGEAREALENFCLLGRNYGLSLLMATQRPTASAISSKVRSQVDLYLIHRLLTQEDIEISRANLLAVYPREVMDGSRQLDFAQLVRSLDRGQVIISASHAAAQDPVNRILIAHVRPRITVHGGEVS